ncbi:MAG: hypothetical protein AAGD14_11735 [Planctomycetota bacterium]
MRQFYSALFWVAVLAAIAIPIAGYALARTSVTSYPTVTIIECDFWTYDAEAMRDSVIDFTLLVAATAVFRLASRR